MHSPGPPASTARVHGALAPGWVTGLVIGLQAAIFGLAVLWVIALAAMHQPGNAGGTTGDPIAVAANVWLLAHGHAIDTSVGVISLIPWGFTLLCMAIGATVAWRFSARSLSCALSAIGSYVGSVAVVCWWRSGELSASLLAWSAVGAAVAIGIGMARAHGARLRALDALPVWWRAGVRVAVATTAAMVVVGAVVGALSAWRQRSMASSMLGDLHVDMSSSVALAVASWGYVPTAGIWSSAWVAGANVSVGSTAATAWGGGAYGELPLVPLLSAVPWQMQGWWPALVVVTLALAALAWWRQAPRLDAGGATARAFATAVVAVAVAWWALSFITAGGVGRGSLAQVGTVATHVGALSAWWAAVGFGVAWGGRGLLSWGIRPRPVREQAGPTNAGAPGTPRQTPPGTRVGPRSSTLETGTPAGLQSSHREPPGPGQPTSP